MTTAIASSAPPCRRHVAAPPRAMRRGARPFGSRLRRLWGMAGRRRRRLLGPVWAAAMAGVMALSTGACATAEELPLPPLTPDFSVVDANDDLSPRAACLEAAREAERRHALPEGLL